jgi:hypothetical protein
MPTTRVFGPFPFRLAAPGQSLAPGQSVPTVWTLDPQLGVGTVNFTAIPLNVPGADGGRLAVRDPTVQVVAGSVAGSSNITLHVVVANVGENPVSDASMITSYVEQ